MNNQARFAGRKGTGFFAALAATLLGGALTTGCDTGASEADDVGSIQLAIQTAPADGLCLRLTADSATTGLKIVKTIALVPNTASQTQVGGLPIGSVGLVGEVFNVACASVTATTPLTWVSSKVTVTITQDYIQPVNLNLFRAGKVNLGVDFMPSTPVEEISLPLRATALAGAPNGKMLLGLTSSQYLWTLSNAFNRTSLTDVGSEPGHIATAADGNIAVTVTTATQLKILNSAGVAKSTITLGMTAGGVVVDSAGVGWVSSTSDPRFLRIANVAGTTAPAAVSFTTSGIAAPGVGLAANGTPRIGTGTGSTNSLLALNAAGATTATISTPILARGIATLTDGTLYIMGLNTGNYVYKITPANVVSPVFSTTTAPTRAPIITTPKGVVLASATGGLVLVKQDGATQSLLLPGNPVIGALALSATDGRVWAADSATNRLLVVTLP